MKLLALLIPLVLGAQSTYPAPGPGRGSYNLTCSAPTMTYRWTPTAGCSTSTPCATDQVSGNNASQPTGGNLPTYGATAGPSSTPALTFSGGQYIIPATPIASPASGFTMYAIVNQTTNSANEAIFGGATNAIEYRVNSSNNPDVLQQSIGGVGTSSQSLSTGTWYTLVFTFNSSTNVWSHYSAAGGTLSLQNNGSTAYPVFGITANLGGASGNSEFFNGKIAEWGYLSSVNTAGIAHWSSCNYGV